LNVSGGCQASVLTTPSHLTPLSTSSLAHPTLFVLAKGSHDVKKAREALASKRFRWAIIEFGGGSTPLEHGFAVLPPKNDEGRLAARRALEATIG
jgi:hypothetical protein